MDGYPAGSLDHNLPFLVVAGLTEAPVNALPFDNELKDQGVLLQSQLPSLETKEAKALREYIASQDAADQPWNPQLATKPYKFRVAFTGRSFVLPPRRARLPEDIETPEFPPVLHSPFSPLSPISPLYPDGLIDAQWIQKHQQMVPSVYLCFYALTSDASMATLNDNQLKKDINILRLALTQSGYKTRLVVALLSDDSESSPSLSEDIQERLENIRRGVAMDPKSFFYIPTQDSFTELEQTTDSILSTIYSHSIEYYRDLGRHARKKRTRGVTPQPTVPPTSGTSQTLTLQDCNVRYDFKAGVFAEFRQEMDSALRSYDQAYEGVLSEDVMDMIPSWSPRWNEARLLTDVITIRAIRCSFWNGQTTSAVRRWRAHRDRIADFVDRRGRGTKNYGWEAWESRWALVMVNLIDKAELAQLAPSTLSLYIQPEKVVMGERLQPWEMLHHTGYWYRDAARHLHSRRALAHAISEEHRRIPDPKPEGANAAKKAYSYDTYLCPEPHEESPLEGPGTNHAQLIIDCLMAARAEFQVRRQHRVSAELSLECAREMARLKAWDDVVALLRPLWVDMSFRSEGWLDITEDLSWLLRAAAAKVGLGELVVSIDWELLNKNFTRRPNWPYDMAKSLDGVDVKSKPIVSLSNDNMTSFVSASFVFKTEEGKAGETCQAQLAVTSTAFPDSAPIVLKQLRVDFAGSLQTITLDHSIEEKTKGSMEKHNTSLAAIALVETTGPESEDVEETERGSVLNGRADLEIKPGCTSVYEMAIPLRESGEARAASVVLNFDTDAFTLDYTIGFQAANVADVWFGPSLSKRRIPRLSSHAIHVQPKPPKMEIRRSAILQQYYANEPIELPLDIFNAEDADATAKLELHVFGEHVPALRVQVDGLEEQSVEAAKEESKFQGLTLGSIDASQSKRAVLHLSPSDAPTSYEITARVGYHLVTDPATPILQVMTFQVTIVNPFEANYDIVPRLHPEPWPSLFDFEGTSETADREELVTHPRGLAQRWSLVCHFASFATEDLQVVEMEAKVLSCLPGARGHAAGQPDLPPAGLIIPPKSMQEVKFDLIVQKLSLDDRGPASLDVAFVLHWRRGTADPSSPVNTTTMSVPRSIVLGTEPRVLASVSYVNAATGLMHLDVTIENASSHFLTFGLSLEPSEEFAFSGAKQTTLHVLPVSRRAVTYRLLPLVRGTYVRPNLVVRDKYFQKVLRIIPTEGMKIDKEGLLLWVPPAEGQPEEEEEDEEDEVDET
ncbi:Trafficking protein particle complex subunit 11 like [Verticillium longisporum]|uniref:Trafficking protein particle complex subunit 11 like n=1 Tax=Verticillium longisporum TaxID=100787 RepID=A0A8I2ZBR9_VERLO|nr:hypothetical protein VdG1_01919 [Verticillium dahliae VDG1]KAG7123443.1 Trafficking protein particle complex subunit 11 like [Verticillium longisporum]RBQ75085.1 hypothetical protein VDGD_05605 [Verticillium dahliae]